MKTKFSIGNIEFNGVKLENISIEQEYTAKEAVDLVYAGKNFVRDLIKDLPEMILDLEKAYNTFEEVDERCEDTAMPESIWKITNIKSEKVADDTCDFINVSLRDLLNRL